MGKKKGNGKVSIKEMFYLYETDTANGTEQEVMTIIFPEINNGKIPKPISEFIKLNEDIRPKAVRTPFGLGIKCLPGISDHARYEAGEFFNCPVRRLELPFKTIFL